VQLEFPVAGCQTYGASESEHDVARFEGPVFRLHHSRRGWLPLVWEVLFPSVIEILLRNPIRSELPSSSGTATCFFTLI
jgi:hypothetical protein